MHIELDDAIVREVDRLAGPGNRMGGRVDPQVARLDHRRRRGAADTKDRAPLRELGDNRGG